MVKCPRGCSLDNLPGTLLAPCAQSEPQSPSPSISSSLADIAAQAQLLQDTLQPRPIFSNSAVSLNDLGINEQVFGEDIEAREEDALRRRRDRSVSTGILLGGPYGPSTHPVRKEAGDVRFAEES